MNETTEANLPRVAFFSDSRGWHKHESSIRLFWESLSDTFSVDSFAQPYKWTTLLDFISAVRDGLFCPTDYDHVVLWAGVVDFSPRPETSCIDDLLGGKFANLVTVNAGRTHYYNRRINSKASTIGRLLSNRFLDGPDSKPDMGDLAPARHEVAYAGELTASLYRPEFLDRIAAELNAIPNLIFIDTCDIHPEWDGNFLKGRPRNISVVSDYNRRLTQRLICPVIRVSEWQQSDIRQFTVDSIHLTQDGSDWIEARLRKEIARIRSASPLSGGNFVLTATDMNFFQSTLMLVESIRETSSGSVDGICILDIGMTKSQRQLLEGQRGVHVVDYLAEDLAVLDGLPFDFFQPQTYGFKSYLTVKAPILIQRSTGLKGPFNLLYIDGGIFLNRSVQTIFDIIEHEGIFCVDHDDCHDLYGENPFFLLNIVCPTLFEEGFEILSDKDLCKPYIKAGFFGYRHGGQWQGLIDEYWRLCLSSSVLSLPKSVTDRNQRMWYRNNTSVAKYATKKLGRAVPAHCFDYSNGRQDQTALSYLVAKYDAPILNSRDFNFTVSTNLSKTSAINIFERLAEKYPETRVDAENFWREKNEDASRLTPANLVPVPHVARQSISTLHRGALARRDQIKYAGRLLNTARNIRDDIFILLGNGPSLADVDLQSLHPYHTMGLNAAYRAYERLGFWPRYFGCFDALVCGHHSAHFKDLIRHSEIEKFFFINYNENKKPIFSEADIQSSPRFQPINFVERTVPEKDRDDILSVSFDPFIDMLTSGTNSVQVALLMGFRKIILLGCDANYTEIIDGAKQDERNKNRIVMERTPAENINYWFDDYQQEGDKFNLPNTQGCQLPAWGRLARSIQLLNINVEIINCSPVSRIDEFKKMPLADAINYFQSFHVSKISEPNVKNRYRHTINNFLESESLAELSLKNRSSVDVYDAGGAVAAPISTELSARLMLDPALLSELEPGRALYEASEALLSAGGPTATHFQRVVDWAVRQRASA